MLGHFMLSICTLYVGIHTVHSLEKQFGFRAFSNSPPRLWKAVPQTLREGTSSTVFHRHLQSWSVLSWVLSCCTVTDTSCPRPDLILIFCLSLSLSGFSPSCCVSLTMLFLCEHDLYMDTEGYANLQSSSSLSFFFFFYRIYSRNIRCWQAS